ncbi:MAG: anaerobic ribonucleoside-triphosphate reductase activating protein [Clostridia bacterium]|nr:anaerobic ribonucleoside-triphosphate reductase activating protein [Clostridia bacterium]
MLRYNTITSPDINNGLGCRLTIWISGCSHRCPGCHNRELWDYNNGKQLFSKEVIDKISKELNLKSYIDGITLCGGDPLDQSDGDLMQLTNFLIELKMNVKRKFNIWIYAGDIYENLVQYDSKLNVLKQCDVLVDGPYEQDKRDITLAFRGSSNQRIIDLNKSLDKWKVVTLDLDK